MPLQSVFHPYHISGNKIKKEAFLPPAGQGISVYQRLCTTPEFCKKYASYPRIESSGYYLEE
jgi:hypothetical protein